MKIKVLDVVFFSFLFLIATLYAPSYLENREKERASAQEKKMLSVFRSTFKNRVSDLKTQCAMISIEAGELDAGNVYYDLHLSKKMGTNKKGEDVLFDYAEMWTDLFIATNHNVETAEKILNPLSKLRDEEISESNIRSLRVKINDAGIRIDQAKKTVNAIRKIVDKIIEHYKPEPI